MSLVSKIMENIFRKQCCKYVNAVLQALNVFYVRDVIINKCNKED